MWDAATARMIAVLHSPGESVTSVSFSPDGKTLAVGSTTGAYLYDVATGREVAAFTKGGAIVESAAFAPDGVRLALEEGNGRTYIWNVKTGDEVAVLAGPPGCVQQAMTSAELCVGSVAFSPGGTGLAVGYGDGSTQVFNTTTWRRTGTVNDPGNAAFVTSVALSPDGKILATGDLQGFTCLWNVATGRQITTLPEPYGNQVASVAFSKDGTKLATGDFDDGTNPPRTPSGTYLWSVS